MYQEMQSKVISLLQFSLVQKHMLIALERNTIRKIFGGPRYEVAKREAPKIFQLLLRDKAVVSIKIKMVLPYKKYLQLH